MTESEQRALIITGVAVVGSLGAYWAYLYYQDPSKAPDITSFIEDVKGQIAIASDTVSSDVGSATGTSSYMDIATSLVARLEGFSSRTYNDAGKLAIGYGHDIKPGDPYNKDSVISQDEGRTLLMQDLQLADMCIENNVNQSLTDNQRAALISFAYNVGCGAFSSSTLLAKVNAGDFDGAAQEFGRWVYASDPNTGQKVVNSDLANVRRPAEEELFTA